MVIALHTPIHNDLIALLSDPLPGHVNVDPVRIAPHACVDLAELDRGACVVHYGVSKFGIKVSIVKENVWVVEPPVEVSFQRFDGLHYPFQFLISCQDNEDRIRSRPVDLWFKAACHKDFVMLLTDFSVPCVSGLCSING